MEPAKGLARRLGLPIRDFDLLEQALVHSSYLHEHPETARAHNERLEFLGDSVVNVVISEALYARHPHDDEGSLSARRAAIVSTAGLSRLAARIELGDWLLLGEGEALRGGRRRPSLLASAFEALTGAVYLDLGYAATRAWLLELAASDIEADQPIGALKSPKSRLQEYTQRRTGARPTYRIVDATGPDHEKQFRIEVIVEDRVVGSGEGPSRRVAETAAAARALARLRAETGGEGGLEAQEPAAEAFQPGAEALEPGGEALEPGGEALEPGGEALEGTPEALAAIADEVENVVEAVERTLEPTPATDAARRDTPRNIDEPENEGLAFPEGERPA